MTPAEITARIAVLEERLAASAGIRATTIGDQSTTFDYDGAVKELARLRQELALSTAGSGTTTRLAAFSKGV
jgi:hypothetical protein